MDPSQRGYPPATTPIMQVPAGMAQVPMGAMMNPQFPQYGMMVPGAPMMQVPMQMAPMANLTQMLADSARGGRASNVFFKTRICNKWRNGSCPFGDKCTYAHGQHELRYIPPELLANLERSQLLQSAQHDPQQSIDHSSAVQGQPSPAGGDTADQRSKSILYYKTKICIPFMSHGYCARGSACTFAHGFQEIRSTFYHDQLSAPLSHVPLQQQQQPQNPSMTNRQSAMQPPAQQQQQGPRTGSSTKQENLPPVERARGASAVMNVGNAADIADDGDIDLAKAAVENGEALHETPYADRAVMPIVDSEAPPEGVEEDGTGDA